MLARWALATGKQSGQQLRGISELDLPSSLVPTFMPRVPLPYVGPGLTAPGATLQRDSFFTGFDGNTAGVVPASDSELAALGRGDWEVLITAMTFYNMSGVIGDRTYVGIAPPGNALGVNTQPILSYFPTAAAGAQFRDAIQFRLVLANDDFRFRVHIPALGAGQAEQHSIFLLAHRMG
jgi:hypothetical protein